jgi:hypothetical protein
MWLTILNKLYSLIRSKSISIAIPIPKPEKLMPKESRDINDCCAILKRRYPLLAMDFEEDTHNGLIITCTYRSPSRQNELYQQGRRNIKVEGIVTYKDGINHLSKHNCYPSKAIDIAVKVSGKVTWDSKYYIPLGALCKKHGLIWGGDWVKLKDYPHIEIDEQIDIV